MESEVATATAAPTPAEPPLPVRVRRAVRDGKGGWLLFFSDECLFGTIKQVFATESAWLPVHEFLLDRCENLNDFDDLTGLPNEYALKKTSPGPVEVSINVEESKVAYDVLGGWGMYEAISACVASALEDEGVHAFRLWGKGTDFAARFQDSAAAQEAMERCARIVHDAVIEVRNKQGQTRVFSGLTLRWGFGRTLDEAWKNRPPHTTELLDRLLEFEASPGYDQSHWWGSTVRVKVMKDLGEFKRW